MSPMRRNHCYTPAKIFGCGTGTKGEVGLELETIGKRLPIEFQKTTLWNIHNDDSVKVRSGEVGKEYVLTQPVGRARVSEALLELHEEFKLVNAHVAEGRISNSVHVHINAQQLSIKQIYTWLTLYFIFEEMLVQWAGDDRVGNLFCLRARDAEGLIRMLSDSAKTDNYSSFGSDAYRYAACNVMALSKFGSLEFRALRGTADPDTIQTWVNVLLAIKDKSQEYKDPVAVLADFSQRSPIGMTAHVIPQPLRSFILHSEHFQDLLYEGARLAQDFVFSTEWSDWVPPKEEMPKGGKTKKVLFNPANTMSTLTNSVFSMESLGAVLPTTGPVPSDAPPSPAPNWAAMYNSYHPNNVCSFRVTLNEQIGCYQRVPGTQAPVRFMKKNLFVQLKNTGYTVKLITRPDGTQRLGIASVHSNPDSVIRWVNANEMEPLGWSPTVEMENILDDF